MALELLGGDLKLLDGDLALIVFLAQRVVLKGVGVLPQVGVAFLFFKSSRLCRSWCLQRARGLVRATAINVRGVSQKVYTRRASAYRTRGTLVARS